MICEKNRTARWARMQFIVSALASVLATVLLTACARAQTNPVYLTNIGSCSPGAVSGHFLYTYCDTGGMSIFDITNPAAPVDVGYTDAAQIMDFTISAGYAYRLV